MVQEKDNFSLSGVTYYSLVPTTISKNTASNTIVNEKHNLEIPVLVEKTKFLPNHKVVFETQNGYFKCDKKVQIHSLTEEEVIFSIPNGIQECNIQVQENNQLKNYSLIKEE
jgi:hypothetical protein